MKKLTLNQVGQKCFYNLRPAVINSMNEKKTITGVSYKDGYASQYVKGGLSPFCFPADEKVKKISKIFTDLEKAFLIANCKWYGKRPFKEELIARWLKICKTRNNKKRFAKILTQTERFVDKILLKAIHNKMSEI